MNIMQNLIKENLWYKQGTLNPFDRNIVDLIFTYK